MGEGSGQGAGTDFAEEDSETDLQKDDVSGVHELEEETDDDSPIDLPNTAFSPVNFSITTRRISDLFSSYNDGELDTTPAFQRGYVWDRTRASRLVESVLLHVPLPTVYTAEEANGREVVIDGQQRLMTFIGYLGNKFPKDGRPFRLTKLKILKDLQGKGFADLSDELKLAFRRYGVSVIKISNTTNPAVKFEIFERLNTGAVSLSAHELRNCIFRGNLNELIKELAQSTPFRRVLALKQAPQRMIDCEMVLRFLTFHERTHLNYPGKMKSFMNDFMEAHRNVSPEKQDEWRNKFYVACDNVFTVFGDKAFRRYKLGSAKNMAGGWEGNINKALYDCLMFWFARYEKRQIVSKKDEIRERVLEMMVGDREFSDAIVLGTSDAGRVKLRFERIQSALAAVVSTPPGERRTFTLQRKQQLFEQDSTCGFCRQRIESLDDAEVDHHVRYAEGGPTSLENARLAHRYCNRADRQGSRPESSEVGAS